jgi:hypothetical protein
MTIWNIEIERVRIVGADRRGLEPAELRALVPRIVRAAVQTAPLPEGRAMRASVRVGAESLAGGDAIAGAVANAVAQAIGGRANG